MGQVWRFGDPAMAELITKNALVRQLVSEKRYKEALRICKDWSQKSEEDRKILRLGYECLIHPRFYEELGMDAEDAVLEAIRVLVRIYGGRV